VATPGRPPPVPPTTEAEHTDNGRHASGNAAVRPRYDFTPGPTGRRTETGRVDAWEDPSTGCLVPPDDKLLAVPSLEENIQVDHGPRHPDGRVAFMPCRCWGYWS
jgi:hypothetical protein